MFATAAPIQLRSDVTAAELRLHTRRTPDASQARRLLALAEIYDGGRRSEAARIGGVGLQIVRDWVVRFNAGGPGGLLDRKAPGQAPRLTAEQLAALARAVEAGPKPYLDGVVRWRLGDLAAWLREEFGVSVSETTVSRALKRLGFRVLTARPQAHGQDPEAMEVFKKTSPRSWQRSASVMPMASGSRCGSRTKRASARRT
jgi:transposase